MLGCGTTERLYSMCWPSEPIEKLRKDISFEIKTSLTFFRQMASAEQSGLSQLVLSATRTERSATAPTKIKHAESIQQVSRSELDRSPKLCAEANAKPFVVASQDLVLSVTQSILLELSLRLES